MARIAIIGGGNMGEALLSGLLRAGRQARDLVVAEPVAERAAHLSQTYSVRVTDVADAAEDAAMVIVAVKPPDVEAVIAAVAESAAQAGGEAVEQVLISVRREGHQLDVPVVLDAEK